MDAFPVGSSLFLLPNRIQHQISWRLFDALTIQGQVKFYDCSETQSSDSSCEVPDKYGSKADTEKDEGIQL